MKAATDRFRSIDVLVNNAGNFCAGYFDEVSPEQVRAQLGTNLFGPMNVTPAVLPVMRLQRSGHVITITCMAGIVGVDFCSAFAASKFALEGWMDTLRTDVEPCRIRTTIVEPGFFRTELLGRGRIRDLARTVHLRIGRTDPANHPRLEGLERLPAQGPSEIRRRPRHNRHRREPAGPAGCRV